MKIGKQKIKSVEIAYSGFKNDMDGFNNFLELAFEVENRSYGGYGIYWV